MSRSIYDRDQPANQPVEPDQTRHGHFHGTHTHLHAAFGAPDSADGLHSHEHTHSGDRSHAPNDMPVGHTHASTSNFFRGLNRGQQEEILAMEQHRSIPDMRDRAAARREAQW